MMEYVCLSLWAFVQESHIAMITPAMPCLSSDHRCEPAKMEEAVAKAKAGHYQVGA